MADRSKRNRQNAASRDRYNAKTYDRINIRVRRDGADGLTADQIKQLAADSGQSVNQLIIDAIKDKFL